LLKKLIHIFHMVVLILAKMNTSIYVWIQLER